MTENLPRLLLNVRNAELAIRQAQDDLDQAVRTAKNAGATWQDIGDALWVSRQAAQMRFRSIGTDMPLPLPPRQVKGT